MEALSPEHLVAAPRLRRCGKAEISLSSAVETMYVNSVSASRLKHGAHLDVLAIQGNLSGSNKPVPVVSSWKYGNSFVIGVSLGLEQLGSCKEACTVLEELIRYGDDEVQRELPVVSPTGSTVALTPPFDSMCCYGYWWNRLQTGGGGIHVAEFGVDYYDTTSIWTEATGDFCSKIHYLQNRKEFTWNGPTEGTEIDTTCTIDGIDQLTRIGWEDSRLHVGFRWLLRDIDSGQVWEGDTWVEEFSPHLWLHRTGYRGGVGYVTMTHGHDYDFQLYVYEYWDPSAYHLAQGSWIWVGDKWQDTGGFFKYDSGAAYSWVKTIIYD